jgi:ABC-type sugar transport system permease subunit
VCGDETLSDRELAANRCDFGDDVLSHPLDDEYHRARSPVWEKITVPLLAPVLTVVFVTQIIGVLKIFDLVLSIAPGSSRAEGTGIAFEMWRKAFSGQNQFGLGAAISTFLLLLFVPFIILRLRTFRREVS